MALFIYVYIRAKCYISYCYICNYEYETMTDRAYSHYYMSPSFQFC